MSSPQPHTQRETPQELLAYVTGFHRDPTPPTPREALRAAPTAWDRFNGSATNVYTAGLMEALGWTISGHARAGVINLERPGKDEGSTSATVGAVAPGVLYVHTSSDPTFSEATPYDAADIYAIAHHGGDKAAADKALTATYGGSRRFLSDVEIAEGLESYRRQGEEAEAREADATAVQQTTGWEAISYSIDELGALPPLTWAVDGWIPEESLSVIYGPRKAGKTFTALSMALHAAEGTPFFGAEVKRQKVAYLIGEGIRGYQNRVQAWRKQNGRTPHDIIFVNAAGKNLRDPEVLQGLIAWMIAHEITFLVVDTINRLTGGMRENDADGMGEFIMAMDVLRSETGATVVPIHHSGKDATQGMRGHSALEGAVDAGIKVTMDAEKPLVKVELALAREIAADRILNLELRPPDGSLTPALIEATYEAELGTDLDRGAKGVLRLIEQAPRTAKDISTLEGLSPQKVRDATTTLLGSGYIVAEGDRWVIA